MCQPHSSHQKLLQGAVDQDMLNHLSLSVELAYVNVHFIKLFVRFPHQSCSTVHENIVNVIPGTLYFPNSLLQRKSCFLFCFLYPWTLDFVLTNSIITHSSLLCIVLKASCPQSTSCSIAALVLCEIGLSAMSLQGETAEFGVESAIVCGTTQSQITNLQQ